MSRLLPGIGLLIFSQTLFAGQYGFNLGAGAPYVAQAGINYLDIPNHFSAEAGFGFFTVSSGFATLRLTKPEVSAKWHPFAGAFFLGLGLGRQTLTVKGTEPTSGASARVSAHSLVTTTSLGWLWSADDGGFFGGLDVGYQNPFDVSTTVDSDIPVSDQAYQDARDLGDKFGSIGLPVMTLLRIGYLY